jgi:hypothetical protein
LPNVGFFVMRDEDDRKCHAKLSLQISGDKRGGFLCLRYVTETAWVEECRASL